MSDYLRFEILEHFAYNERLSKAMVERTFGQHIHITKTNRSVKHHRPEILKAFEFLKKGKLIIELNTDPGLGRVYSRGRPQKYYKITEHGLKKLIADRRISNTQFWKVLLGYCSNIDTVLTPDKIKEFLIIFKSHYMRFQNHGFISHFEAFHALCKYWFKKDMLVSDGISISQKVLEVLATNSNISIDKLVGKVGESEPDVRKILSLYSYGHKSVDVFYDEDYEKENLKFLTQNIITINKNENGSTCELSLFGVILTFCIILYNKAGKLRRGLFLKEYSFQKYYDKIAYNYSHKLPLIFGKWPRLRQFLRAFAISNFEELLDEALIESRSDSASVITGGNNEIVQGILTIMQYNRSLMQDLVNAGTEVLGDDFWARFNPIVHLYLKDNIRFNKINSICAVLEEILIQLNLMSYKYPRRGLITFTTLDPNRILKQLEGAFAEEISALYYVNLLVHNAEIEDLSKDKIAGFYRQPLLSFQEDKRKLSIGDWVKDWTKDLSGIYKQISETIEGWSTHITFV
ncbi:MAG: hypothetical protein ACRD8W_10510 [Nitrososphaeraceae archaeon]